MSVFLKIIVIREIISGDLILYIMTIVNKSTFDFVIAMTDFKYFHETQTPSTLYIVLHS